MKRPLVFLLASVFLGFASARAAETTGAAVTPAAIVDKVTAANGTLAWDGLRLGMTLEEAGTVVGKALTLSPGSEGVKTTERYATSLVRDGVKVDLSFESDSPTAALVFIRANFPAGAAVDIPALTERLKTQAPALAPIDGSTALMLPGTDYQAEPKAEGVNLGANWLF